MRFLCVSDIHGNAKALRAVLRETEHRAWHQLLVCGDLLFPGPEPLETWKLLVENRAVCVQGVGDRAVATIDPTKLTPISREQGDRVRRLLATKTEIGELILARLAKLPSTVRLPLESGDEMLLVHGSPVDPTEPMTADMSDEELGALIGDDPADIIVCGASHVPFYRQIDDVHIVNVGSVGEAPSGQVAHATLIDASLQGVMVEQFEVPY